MHNDTKMDNPLCTFYFMIIVLFVYTCALLMTPEHMICDIAQWTCYVTILVPCNLCVGQLHQTEAEFSGTDYSGADRKKNKRYKAKKALLRRGLISRWCLKIVKHKHPGIIQDIITPYTLLNAITLNLFLSRYSYLNSWIVCFEDLWTRCLKVAKQKPSTKTSKRLN